MHAPIHRARNRFGAIAALVLAGGLTACGTDGEPTPTSSVPSAQTSLSGSADATKVDDEPTVGSDRNTDPKTTRPSDDALLAVVDVRLGAHDGFDRVAVEFAGTGTPGWSVAYTTNPQQQGSGRPLQVAGDSMLAIDIDGTTYPFELGVQDPPMTPLTNPDTPHVVQVVNGGTFEGRTQLVAGVTGAPRPFVVFTLQSPTRLVIDISSR